MSVDLLLLAKVEESIVIKVGTAMAKITIIIIISMSVKPWLLLSVFLSFMNDFILNIFLRNGKRMVLKSINEVLLIISAADKNNLAKKFNFPRILHTRIKRRIFRANPKAQSN